jgi:hypothetical protein
MPDHARNGRCLLLGERQEPRCGTCARKGPEKASVRLGGPAKEVAQIAAAIGREFSHKLLAAVVDKPEAKLGSALDRIIAAGLLFRQGMPPHASYLFKHALVQDAAYSTLLRAPHTTCPHR